MKTTFHLYELRPDERQYRMNSAVLLPDDFVLVIDVPETPEYLDNYSEIAAAQLTNQDIPKPLFTPAAVKFCLSYLEKQLNPENISPDDFDQKSSDDEDWDKPEKETKESSEEKSDDGWDDDKTQSDDDEDWDDNTEDWDEKE